MKTTIFGGAIAATVCTFAIGLSAQTTGQPPTPQTRSGSSDSITVTGCLQRESPSATPGATGTSGSTAAKSETKFVLNVTPSAGSPAGTAGTSGSTASNYRLDADDAKLTPHVGHKVEITGTVDKAMSGSSPAPGGTASGAAASNAPKLKVDAVKMIAASCAE